MGTPSRIIVIGAGVSGLACARELRQRGYQVLVIEARSRVGGRLKGEYLELGSEYPSSLPITDERRGRKRPIGGLDTTPSTRQHPVDVGGALIHGVKDNPIHQITSQMGVPTHSISDYCLLLDESGWPFDPKVDEKMSTFFNDCLDTTFARAEQDRDSKESFGSLFDNVCQEKSRGMGGSTATTSNGGNGGVDLNPLLKWHRANLELPSGASFYDLGMTWNDDEPYGFDGDHAAVEPSWKLVMERLADDLDILKDSPVIEVRIVLPDGTTPDQVVAGKVAPAYDDNDDVSIDDDQEVPKGTDETETAMSEQTRSEEGLGTNDISTDPVDTDIIPIVESTPHEHSSFLPRLPTMARSPYLSNGKLKRKKRARSVGFEVTRVSRRLRGDDANVRRSSRSTKGVIEMLQVGRDGSLGYENPKMKLQRRRGKSKKNTNINQHDGGDSKQNEEEAVYADVVEPSSKVHVTLENGSVLEADAVVCTLPLGILKIPQGQHGHVRFLPPLPGPKRTVIEKLGCGLLNKCAMSFPNVFWQDSEFLGLAGTEHSYLVLNAVKYTKKPILIFMYGGSFAKEVESWTDSEIVSDCLEVLKRICGKEVPPPVDYCVTRWGQEQFSRMAFTYIPPGVDGPKDLTAMSKAIYDPSLPDKPLLMFAGEHTTPYHPSTMHGAFLSGVREAYRYDLFVAPALNDYMKFQDNGHIYQHTFPTRKVYIKSSNRARKNEPKKLNSNGTTDHETRKIHEKRSRRRGIGGMTLRKRPQAIVETTPSLHIAVKHRLPPAPCTPDIVMRRSQRSAASVKLVSSTDVPWTGDEAPGDTQAVQKQLNKFRINQLEDRSLARALESYGSNCDLIRERILPVHGSSRKRSANDIRRRWEILTTDKLQQPEGWEAWKAERIVVSHQKEKGEPISGPTTNGASLRRSHRDTKPRDFIVYGK